MIQSWLIFLSDNNIKHSALSDLNFARWKAI